MQTIVEAIQEALGIGVETQTKMVLSLGIAAGTWMIRFLVMRLVCARTEDVRTRYMWRKTSGYISVIAAMLLVGRVWFQGLHSVATFLGLFSAGLAIALKDLVANFAGWLFILWRRPFELGDRIEVGDHAGDVIDIRVFQFTLMEIGNWVDADQSTGRVIHVPNLTVLNQVVANYSKGFQYIWDEVPVLITFESNWEDAKRILTEIGRKHAESLSEEAEKRVREAARKYFIFYKNLTPTVYTSVRDSGVLLTIRYLCEPRRRRGSEQAIWEDILREFHERPDIDFAYPTQRFYDLKREA